MKIYYLLALMIVSIQFDSWSQCDNEVSTDPNNPTNVTLPDDESTGIPYDLDERYLNGFDWWTPSLYVLDDMYYNAPNDPYGPMSNIQSSSGLSNYYSYLNKFSSTGIAPEEMNPQNGWELVLANLGRYPDNQTQHSEIDLQSIPYLVFYHRYKGTIRVFVRYGFNTFPNDAIDGVKINLFYDLDGNSNNLSGILRHGEGIDQTLDQPTNTNALTAVAPPNGAANFWMSADFQIAYDPCVCQYPTDLKLEFEYFSTTSLKLTGRGISVDEDIIDSNGEINNLDFLGGVDFSSSPNAENGFLIYKNMAALAADYIEEMTAYQAELDLVNQHNDKVERNLVIIKVFKKAVAAGLTALAGSPELSNLALKAPSLLFDPTDEADSTKRANFFIKVEEILGEELDLFISENVSKKSEPEKPIMPTATFTEMNFEGELFNSLALNGPQFSTPGSFRNGPNTLNEPDNVYAYPIYNDPLGQFALLKKPQVEISYSTKENFCSNYASYTFDEGPFGDLLQYDLYSASVTDVMQIKLKEDLEYTFNNSLDIKEYEIKAKFVVEGELELSNSPHIVNNVNSNFFTSVTSSPQNNINIESISFNPKENESYKTSAINFDSLNFTTTGVPIDAFKNTVSSFGVTKTLTHPDIDDYNTFEIENYTESLYSSCSSMNELLSERTPFYNRKDVYLKLLVTVVYDGQKDDGSPHEYTYSYTYKLDPSDIDETATSPLFPNLPGSSGDITQYPENLNLNGENFDGSPVEGCELNGNTYTCKAWNNITVEGDFTVASGYFVDVEAGNEVNIVAESNTPDEMHFSIVPVLDFSDPMPPQNATAVAAFCNDNNAYQANTSVKSGKTVDNNEGSTKSLGIENTASDFNFALYPNPTSGQTNASIVLENDAKASLIVTDLSGKKLIHQLNNELLNEGENRLILDSHSLAPGIYLVHLSVNGKKHVKRLVKQ